jgi:hypothetical protein
MFVLYGRKPASELGWLESCTPTVQDFGTF